MMSIQIKTYSGSSLVEGAKIARKYRLFVPRQWRLSEEFKDICESPEYFTNSKIVMAFKDKKPVGVVLKNNSNLIQAFVRKSERRQGIGSVLVSKVKSKDSYAMTGLKKGQSKKFWQQTGVKFREWY